MISFRVCMQPLQHLNSLVEDVQTHKFILNYTGLKRKKHTQNMTVHFKLNRLKKKLKHTKNRLNVLNAQSSSSPSSPATLEVRVQN